MIDTVHGPTREQDRYLTQVAARLADLPVEERDELLDELRQHLRDVAAEGDGDLETQLGPADDFAAELRASAGLAAAPTTGPGTVPAWLRDLDRRALTAVRRRWSAVRAHPDVATSLEGLRQAAPLWWAIRGYVAVLAYDLVQGGTNQLWSFPFPGVSGSRLLGFTLGLLGAGASVLLGRASRRGGWVARATSAALTVGVALGLLALSSTVRNAAWATQLAVEDGIFQDDVAVDGHLTSSTGDPITNLHPYGPDGEPLDGVLLYDQDGRPVDLVVEHLPDGRRIVTSYPLTEDGSPVTNAFPQRQVLRPDPYADDELGGHLGADGDPTRPPAVRDVPVLEPADGADADAEADAAEEGDASDASDGPAEGAAEGGPAASGQ